MINKKPSANVWEAVSRNLTNNGQGKYTRNYPVNQNESIKARFLRLRKGNR